MVTRDNFIKFCSTTPELVSWLDYFGDIDEFGVEVLNPRWLQTHTHTLSLFLSLSTHTHTHTHTQ